MLPPGHCTALQPSPPTPAIEVAGRSIELGLGQRFQVRDDEIYF